MIEPTISIVMPLYNKSETVISSIESVRAQTVTTWELIVVNDGSTDDSWDKVSSLSDSRIRLINQANKGVSAARNRGIAHSRAELVAFLDADDRWDSGYLATILSLARDYPGAGWFATRYRVRHPRFGDYDARLRGLPPGFKRGLVEQYFDVARSSDPVAWTSATVVKRTAIRSIGGFPEGIDSGEDLLTWAQLAVRFPLAYDTRTFAIYYASSHERRPDPLQRVGASLSDLVTAYPEIIGLRKYLGLWYRMQAVMAMRSKQPRLARLCAWRSFFHDPGQVRNGYTLLLACLPMYLQGHLDQFLRRLTRT